MAFYSPSLRSTSTISDLLGDADALNTEVGAESEEAVTYDAEVDMGSPSVSVTFIRPTRPRLTTYCRTETLSARIQLRQSIDI